MSQIPILLMNPAPSAGRKGKQKPMKRKPSRKANPRRRPTGRRTSKITRRRSIRRRRNPSLQIKPVAFGALAGAGVAAIAYALDGLPQLTNRNRALALLGGGLGLGVVASMWSGPIGAGLAAGGVAIGGHVLIGLLTADAPAAPATTTEGLGALRAELGALRAELNAPQLGAVYDESASSYPAGLGAIRYQEYASR